MCTCRADSHGVSNKAHTASTTCEEKQRLDARQPTIRRENTSITNATYTNPRQVAT